MHGDWNKQRQIEHANSLHTAPQQHSHDVADNGPAGTTAEGSCTRSPLFKCSSNLTAGIERSCVACCAVPRRANAYLPRASQRDDHSFATLAQLPLASSRLVAAAPADAAEEAEEEWEGERAVAAIASSGELLSSSISPEHSRSRCIFMYATASRFVHIGHCAYIASFSPAGFAPSGSDCTRLIMLDEVVPAGAPCEWAIRWG